MSIGFLLTVIFINAISTYYIFREFRIPSKEGAAAHGFMAGRFLAIAYLTTTKNSLFIILTGMSLETQIKIHKVWSYFVFPLLFVHIYREIVENPLKLTDQRMMTGLLAAVTFGLIILTGVSF